MTKEPETNSQLAKLLATENIDIRLSPSARTASFDVKKRVLVLPVWKEISEDLRHLLIVHEVGHALDTPCEGWLEAIKSIAKKLHGDDDKKYISAIKGFMNVIEDARIDKRQKRRYPGSRRNYLIGYKELIDRDFFGTSKKDVNTLSFIDRLNIYYKGGSIHNNITFSLEERAFLKRTGETETFQQVVDLTEEIYAWAKAQGEKQNKSKKESGEDSSSNESEDGTTEYDDDLDEEGAESESTEDAEGVEDSEEEYDTDEYSEDDGEESGKNSSNSSNMFDPKSEEKDEEVIPNSETDKAWEENQSLILSNSDMNYVYVDLPIPNYANIVDDYKKVLFEHAIQFKNKDLEERTFIADRVKKIKSDENPTVTYMAKEFEMRKSADIYSRVSIAKTGTIDTNKLHSYKYSEDIFRKLSVVPQGKNHGFVIFLDWSGSMVSQLPYTVRQLVGLTMFCKRVQIPFEVYLFRDALYNAEPCFVSNRMTRMEPSIFKNFKLRNILSSRMNAVDLNNAYMYLLNMTYVRTSVDPMSSTPLNQTIYVADKIVNDFRIKNKVQIVNTVFLTDGDSDPIRQSREINDSMVRNTKTRLIIQDPKTKKEYVLSGHAYSSTSDGRTVSTYRAVTITLLSMLKERTNSNLVGFFLTSARYSKMIYRFFLGNMQNEKYEETIKSSWKNDHFVNVPSEGYDEYYVIDTTKRKYSEMELNVNSSMTRSKIAKEFQRFSERKSINRILINRFMKKIAGNSK